MRKNLPEITQTCITPDGIVLGNLGRYHFQLYRFIRIPIREPESLLFISVAANKAQLPINVKQSLDKKDDIPRGLYEDFKVDYFIGVPFD